MISKVLINNDSIEIYTDEDVLLSKTPALHKSLVATAQKFYVLINHQNNLLEVFDPTSELISSMQMNNKVLLKTIEERIIVKNGMFIETYDIFCNKLHINNANAAFSKLKGQSLLALKGSLQLHLSEINSLKGDMVKNSQYEHSAHLATITSKLEELIALCTH